MLECVINVSEGRDRNRVRTIAQAAGSHLLDVHSDEHHHRSVITVVGEDAARAVAEAAVELIDLARHDGVHPRLGAVDVVPFVALDGTPRSEARSARDRFAGWFATRHGVPCFLYGDDRSLPEVRRRAFRDLMPDAGPDRPHPSAGAVAVGERPVLVAYNVWVGGLDLDAARAAAVAVRGDGIRALGLAVGERVQVSMNLIEPHRVGPAAAHDRVAAAVAALDGTVEGCELVGLVPTDVLTSVPEHRWPELDLAPERTIEARLEASGLR